MEINSTSLPTVTGSGLDRLMELIGEAATDFEKEYRVETQRIRMEKMQLQQEQEGAEDTGEGVKVPLIERVSLGCEIPVVGAGSDDSGEEDDRAEEMDPEDREENAFRDFIQKRRVDQAAKVRKEDG